MYDVRSREIWRRCSASFELDLQAAKRASSISYYGWRTTRKGLHGFLDKLENRTFELLLERTADVSIHARRTAFLQNNSAVSSSDGVVNTTTTPMAIRREKPNTRGNRDQRTEEDNVAVQDWKESGHPVEDRVCCELDQNREARNSMLDAETVVKRGHAENRDYINEQRLEIQEEIDRIKNEEPIETDQHDRNMGKEVEEEFTETDSKSTNIEDDSCLKEQEDVDVINENAIDKGQHGRDMDKGGEEEFTDTYFESTSIEDDNMDRESNDDMRAEQDHVNIRATKSVDGLQLHDYIESEPIETSECVDTQESAAALIDVIRRDGLLLKDMTSDEEQHQVEKANSQTMEDSHHNDGNELVNLTDMHHRLQQEDEIDDPFSMTIAEELSEKTLNGCVTKPTIITTSESECCELEAGNQRNADDSPLTRSRTLPDEPVGMEPAMAETVTGLVALRKLQFETVLFNDNESFKTDWAPRMISETHDARYGCESTAFFNDHHDDSVVESPDDSRWVEETAGSGLRAETLTMPLIWSGDNHREKTVDLLDTIGKRSTSRSAETRGKIMENPESRYLIPEPNLSVCQSAVIVFAMLAIVKAMIVIIRRLST